MRIAHKKKRNYVAFVTYILVNFNFNIVSIALKQTFQTRKTVFSVKIFIRLRSNLIYVRFY